MNLNNRLIFLKYKIKKSISKFLDLDLSYKISYIIFGFKKILDKQYFIGLFYLIFEILYILFFLKYGIFNIKKLYTLGTNPPSWNITIDGFYDFKFNDNSIMILIYGLFTILSVLLFFYIWHKNNNSIYTNYRIKNYKKYDYYFNELISFYDNKSINNDESLNKIIKIKKNDIENILSKMNCKSRYIKNLIYESIIIQYNKINNSKIFFNYKIENNLLYGKNNLYSKKIHDFDLLIFFYSSYFKMKKYYDDIINYCINNKIVNKSKYLKNKLILYFLNTYNLDIKDANKIYLLLKKNQNNNFNQNDIKNIIKKIKINKNNYMMKFSNKYYPYYNTLKDEIKLLLDKKFYILILFFPILGILIFTIIPMLFSIFIAFTNYGNGHMPPMQLFNWVGFKNFFTIFFPSENSIYKGLPKALLKTINWTLIWAFFSTFSNYFLGIIVALMINKKGIKFKKMWRTIFIFTIAIPQFILLLSVGTLLKDSGAIGTLFFNIFNKRLGFGSINKFSNILITKILIILINIWIGIPYTILITTGILLNIPNELYESAKVDGANFFIQFKTITMPYILFVTGPYLITQFIGNINNFNIIYFLTGGNPSLSGDGLLGLGQTDLLITFLYKIITSNENPQYGIASSIGIIIFIICSILSLILFKKFKLFKEDTII